jgi:aminoglycoside 6'-N-acetyltransferase
MSAASNVPQIQVRAAPAWRFLPLARADFPLLAHWLRQPHVARWWADDPSPAALEADYGGVVDGSEPAEVFLAWHGDRAVGLVQRLRLAAYPDYLAQLAPLLAVPADSWSIDYLVGEAADIGHGWGTAMIEAFVSRLWAEVPQAICLLVPVHAENHASWRALERAGFVRAASGELEPDNPVDSRAHHVYRLVRPSK